MAESSYIKKKKNWTEVLTANPLLIYREKRWVMGHRTVTRLMFASPLHTASSSKLLPPQVVALPPALWFPGSLEHVFRHLKGLCVLLIFSIHSTH